MTNTLTNDRSDRQIDYRFKILYAVGILMVLCGHCEGGGITLQLADWFPYAGLHVALFVFCSGYFYKTESEENVPGYLWKKIKTLIIPLYLYNIAYGVIVQISHIKYFKIGGEFTLYNLFVAPIIDGHQFEYNLAGWFIMPLFMVQVLNILYRKGLKKICKNIPEWMFFVIGIVLGIAGNQLACNGYNTGWWLALVRMLYFVPFYSLGIFYNRTLEKYDKKIPGMVYFAVVMGIKLALTCYYGKYLMYTASQCNDFTEGPVMPIIIGYLGIAMWMRIAAILEPVLGKNKYVNLLADNTYSIMMNQFLGFMIVKTFYGVCAKLFHVFQDFDFVSYENNLWWYYMPRRVGQTRIFYLLAAIIFSICVQYAINYVKSRCRKIHENAKKQTV